MKTEKIGAIHHSLHLNVYILHCGLSIYSGYLQMRHRLGRLRKCWRDNLRNQ